MKKEDFVIEKILHCHLWNDPDPPPKSTPIPELEFTCDDHFFDMIA